MAKSMQMGAMQSHAMICVLFQLMGRGGFRCKEKLKTATAKTKSLAAELKDTRKELDKVQARFKSFRRRHPAHHLSVEWNNVQEG